ncbi:MAG: hypothetical protein HGA54_07360 [Actinobacteria bacterium]|nr:hypothetical protein [Actinomycetota bacterium]
MADYVQNATEVFIEPVDYDGTGRIPTRDWTMGLIDHEWKVEKKMV